MGITLSRASVSLLPKLGGQPKVDPKDLGFEVTLNAVTLAIMTCRSALKLDDIRKAARVLQKAKKYYGAVLRYSGPLLTPDRIRWLELKSVELEGAIAKLEAKCLESWPDGKFDSKPKKESRPRT
jgi:hypothetical protein